MSVVTLAGPAGASPKNKPKSSFQHELQAKMKERKSKGMAVDLTETEDDGDNHDDNEDSDDDFLSTFIKKKTESKEGGAKTAHDPLKSSSLRKQDLITQQSQFTQQQTSKEPNKNNKLLDTKDKKQNPNRPKNSLDEYLLDNGDENRNEQKPWQPPAFKELEQKAQLQEKPIPKPRSHVESAPSSGRSTVKSGSTTPTSHAEASDDGEDELLGAYTRQLTQRGGSLSELADKTSKAKAGKGEKPYSNVGSGRHTPIDKSPTGVVKHDGDFKNVPIVTKTREGHNQDSQSSTPREKSPSPGRTTPKSLEPMSKGQKQPLISDEDDSSDDGKQKKNKLVTTQRQSPLLSKVESSADPFGFLKTSGRSSPMDKPAEKTTSGRVTPKALESKGKDKKQSQYSDANDAFEEQKKKNLAQRDIPVLSKSGGSFDPSSFLTKSGKSSPSDKLEKAPTSGRTTPKVIDSKAKDWKGSRNSDDDGSDDDTQKRMLAAAVRGSSPFKPEDSSDPFSLLKKAGRSSPNDKSSRKADASGRTTPKELESKSKDKKGSHHADGEKSVDGNQKKKSVEALQGSNAYKPQSSDSFSIMKKADPGSPSEKLAEKSLYGRTTPKLDHSKLQDFGHSDKRQKKEPSLEDVFGNRNGLSSDQPKPRIPRTVLQSQSSDEKDVVDVDRKSPIVKKGSYLSQLLGDHSTHEKPMPPRSAASSPYLNRLLGDENDSTAKVDSKQKSKTSFIDGLLTDEGQKTLSRKKVMRKDSRQERPQDDGESSVCLDVDRDPNMIERMKMEQEERKQTADQKPHTESQTAGLMIDEVAYAQHSLSVSYKEPVNITDKPNKGVTRPKPRPASTTPTSPRSNLSFESASEIRQYIYDEWKEKKMAAAREQLLNRRQLEKQEKLKKDKDAQSKLLECKASYDTWKQRKDEMLKEQQEKNKKLEQQKLEEEKKEKQKKQEAELVIFKRWKESKDNEILEDKEKSKKQALEMKTEREEEKQRKLKDAESAFRGWKKRKDATIKKIIKESKTLEKEKTTQLLTNTQRREQEAEILYEKWLQKKEEQKKRERREKRERAARRNSDEEERPPWSPANKTIPYGR